MKKKILLAALSMVLVVNFCLSQDLLSYTYVGSHVEKDSTGITKKSPQFNFKAYSKDSYLENISSEMAGEHFLGILVSKKIYLFNKFYTTEENLFPGDPATKTIIKKPIIHEAVKRIERDLRKSVKKGDISISEASSTMNAVLDVALNIPTEDTREFEKVLKRTSSTESKIELFTKRVQLNY